MNITSNFQPTPFISQRALDSLPHNSAPLAPKDDGKFTIDDIICPFLRTAYNEGDLKVDAEGNAKNLPQVLREKAGASWAMTGIANHAAKKLSVDGNWEAFKADSFNLQDLEGNTLDHSGDSQILRGGFNQERLDKALSFSSDGERLTLADLREFQKVNLEEEPGKRGEVLGAAEFALLVKTFGRTDGLGIKFIKNADFIRLYKDNKWPEDWQAPKPGSLNFFSTGKIVTEYFRSDSKAEVSATAPSQTPDQKASAACPFLSGQTFDMAEAAKQHADKLA